MNRKRGAAYCGLACCLCTSQEDCPGCRNGKEELLLQKRQNTGCADGMRDCACSGHAEEGESMKQGHGSREAGEELGWDD